MTRETHTNTNTSERLIAALAAGAAIGVLAGAAGWRERRRLRRGTRRLAGRLRYLRGAARGACYRLAGQHPDRTVDDGVLADRVRSALGQVLRTLDLPRLHVSVDRHVVRLDGEVDSELVATVVTAVVRELPGVAAVDSRLHIGLLPSNTRPHQGRVWQRRPSPTLRRLFAATGPAASNGKLTGGLARARLTAHAVVACFTACLPPAARRRLLATLPADVRRLAELPQGHRSLSRALPARDLRGLTAAVAGWSRLDQAAAEQATVAVLAALREQLPERQADRIGRAVPTGLQQLWPATAAPAVIDAVGLQRAGHPDPERALARAK